MVEKMIKEKRNNRLLFEHYMTNGVMYMVGAEEWKKKVLSGDYKPSEVATASDEAMTLLTYENYWAYWNDTFHKVEEDKVRRPPYTRQEAMKHGVWSEEGITRFNTLLEEVKRDRASRAGLKVEEKYQSERKSKKGANRKRKRVVAPSSVRVISELSEVSDSEESEESKEEEDS